MSLFHLLLHMPPVLCYPADSHEPGIACHFTVRAPVAFVSPSMTATAMTRSPVNVMALSDRMEESHTPAFLDQTVYV